MLTSSFALKRSGSFGADAANNVRILYGGSVKPDNAKSLHGAA